MSPLVPIGTAIVTAADALGMDGRRAIPKGSAGRVVALPVDPEHAYRIRLADGDECSLVRDQFQILSHFQSAPDAPIDPLAERGLFDHVIYRCVVGSRAYGLDHDASDTDRRGIYLPPASMHWSVYGVPEQLENNATQECYWELEKFLRLCLKANPNALEALYSPLVEHADPIAQELRDIASAFLSRMIYQTFNGYAMSQFRKLEQDMRARGQIKWKHAMHLLRLLISGAHALKSGTLELRVGKERERLLEVRDGALPWNAVDAWRRELHRAFESAFVASTLPDRPDYQRANALLIRARALMARKEQLL